VKELQPFWGVLWADFQDYQRAEEKGMEVGQVKMSESPLFFPKSIMLFLNK
jgi:hypothetical protein